jgi:signal transduction histidine kinase
VERALYFCCREALQNAHKHARDANLVRVEITEHRRTVVFEVSDDGSGFEMRRAAAGAGLRNMEDRVASLGGMLEIESSIDEVTLVRGVIPVSRAVRNS